MWDKSYNTRLKAYLFLITKIWEKLAAKLIITNWILNITKSYLKHK